MNKLAIKYGLLVIVVVAVIVLLGIALSNSESSQNASSHSTTQLDMMLDKPFPNVLLYDKDGKAYSAASFRGKNTVLFFSEGIMCYPACWDEIAALAADQRLNNADTSVLSVVTDRPQEWATAKEKMPDLARAAILFDQGSAASKALGVINLPSSMHAGSMPGHTYIVLDKQGIVKYVYDDPSMAKNGDKLAAEILKLNN